MQEPTRGSSCLQAVKFALSFIAENDLLEKQPLIVRNTAKDLRFEQFTGETFDFIRSVRLYPPPPSTSRSALLTYARL